MSWNKGGDNWNESFHSQRTQQRSDPATNTSWRRSVRQVWLQVTNWLKSWSKISPKYTAHWITRISSVSCTTAERFSSLGHNNQAAERDQVPRMQYWTQRRLYNIARETAMVPGETQTTGRAYTTEFKLAKTRRSEHPRTAGQNDRVPFRRHRRTDASHRRVRRKRID